MGVDDPFPGQPFEPVEERHRPIAEVVVEPLGHRRQRLLDDVRGVEAGRDPVVHPQGNRPLQAIAVPLEELLGFGRSSR